jgi:8-oxo-dGTP diphosphatase
VTNNTSHINWPRVPYVGVGCIVVRDDRVLMVRSPRGLWSTPGGHLDFGESPEACAARETFEETGVHVTNVEFVAITNDILEDVDKHYVTIWMRGDPDESEAVVGDPAEIVEVGWFSPDALPSPRYLFFENLLAGRSMPPAPHTAATILRADGRRSPIDIREE